MTINTDARRGAPLVIDRDRPSRKELSELFSRWVAWPLFEKDNRTHVLPALRQLERTQWLRAGELASRQWENVLRILTDAYQHTDYYRRVFDAAGVHPRDITSPRDLSALPILTKADIQQHGDELIRHGASKADLIPAKTGGSTGKSLTTYADWACRDLRNAAAIRSDRWAGWDMGVKRAALWGNPPVAESWRARVRQACFDRMVYLDTMNLNDASMGAFVDLWRTYRPRTLFGHSHSLFIWAQWLRENKITSIRPTGIISTSMMLLAPEREVIEQAFACRVTNRYGCEEVGLIACECDEHDGMHINVDHLFVEVLRDDGSPAGEDEPGRLVVTDLINHGQPLIRYRIEDVGTWTSRHCPCGRGLPLLQSLNGRVADFLMKADGSRVAGVSLVERTLTALEGIEQMQIVQESIDAITLKVVRMPSYTSAVEDALVGEFHTVFGSSVSVSVDYVERIPQLPSGKYRFAICRI